MFKSCTKQKKRDMAQCNCQIIDQNQNMYTCAKTAAANCKLGSKVSGTT